MRHLRYCLAIVLHSASFMPLTRRRQRRYSAIRGLHSPGRSKLGYYEFDNYRANVSEVSPSWLSFKLECASDVAGCDLLEGETSTLGRRWFIRDLASTRASETHRRQLYDINRVVRMMSKRRKPRKDHSGLETSCVAMICGSFRRLYMYSCRSIVLRFLIGPSIILLHLHTLVVVPILAAYKIRS